MSFVTLLLAFTSTTVLLTGCGGNESGSGAGGNTTSQLNNLASTAPPQGTEQSFAVLGGQTVTNTGPSVITGNLGVSPGSAITGFPPGLVTGGTTHAADAVALQAQNDTITTY
ncbi:MAG: DUF3494 domain-containing protein, partial [Gammaproteobacteria bacterium]|nr:DUF3494 domain-containing protein [Gammaproteobacteria bacterium]